MKNISDKNCRKNQNVTFYVQCFFLRKSCLIWDNVAKYVAARQATGHHV